MKKFVLTLVSVAFVATTAMAQSIPNLPKKLHSGSWKAGHVQGVAVDAKQEFIYLSFTTMLVKMNMKGEVIGTVTGLLGHLGCLEFNEEDGRVYGSLEYKNDAIGKSILKQEGVANQLETGFYVAIFDVEKINRMDMSAERDSVMTTVLLKSVVEDYTANVKTKSGEVLEHRHGCSGFDGISFGLAFDGSGKRMLTVAYGIYGDTTRTDNDYQVLLQYDTEKWSKYEAPLSQEKMHHRGPSKPYGKYFVYTGNTRWGVQNLEYDKDSNLWFLACYPGRKTTFANYTLFAVDATKPAVAQPLRGVSYIKEGKVLQLAEVGTPDPKNPDIRGWYNKLGVYGLCSLGNGYFYLAEAGGGKGNRLATLHLAQFTNNNSCAFKLLE